MENTSQNPSSKDILQEPYQGPGPAVTSAGYVAASHLVTMIASGFVFGTIGALAHKQVTAVQETFTRIGLEHGASPNLLKRNGAKIIGGIPKAFTWCVEHVPFSERVTGSARLEGKAPSVIFMAGLGVAGGWISSTIWGIAKGSHIGNAGKRQFKRAQQEIHDLREDNADLNHINDQLHARYVRAASRLSTIEASYPNVAQDLALQDAQAVEQPAPKLEVQLDANEHLGRLTQDERAQTVA